MKLIYCIRATYNPGGMERVLLNKVTYLVKKLGWEVMIVTTDQQERPPFYPFPEEVRMVDLNVNYADDNEKPVWQKISGYLRRKKLHRQRLEALLMQERADIVVSLYPSESSFIPSIHDGSKKVLELHFCKFFRLQYGRTGLLGLIDKLRTYQDERIVRRFDKFIVLTDEDKGYWGNLPNIQTIPNAALPSHMPSDKDGTCHRVIAVGRLDYQKGFDRLIKAWDIVQKNGKFRDWKLDIFGQGEWHGMLQQMIEDRGLSETAHIHKPTNAIQQEYNQSDFIVMTSNYEGFGMVLVEAMSCGIPAVAFDCKCGPRDIIHHGKNGLLVKNGDIEGLAVAMMKLMEDGDYRSMLSRNTQQVTDIYSEENVMKLWIEMFSAL